MKVCSDRKSLNFSSEGCREMFGGLIFADKSQMYATLSTETRANTVEMLHIKNFNDSPMSV
jgi:hypothetical protein